MFLFNKDYAEDLEYMRKGYENGILSAEEAILMQLILDVLRGTACSGITASGSTTASGERITCSILEIFPISV